METMRFVILLILGTTVGAGIGFLAAKVLLKKLVGAYKSSGSQQFEQIINERLMSVDKESVAAFTEKSAVRIRTWIQRWYQQNSSNSMPLREAFERVVSAEAVDQMADGIRERLTAIILNELSQRDSGSALSHIMMERVRQRIALPGIMNNALASMEAPMANVVNHTINEYAPSLLDREIGNMENRILDMRLCDLTEKSSVSVERMLDMLTQLCVAFCNEHMEEMLQSADIGKVIAHTVEAVTNEQLDVFWKELIAKEQKLLVMLGSIAGFTASGLALIGTLL